MENRCASRCPPDGRTRRDLQESQETLEAREWEVIIHREAAR